MKRRLLVGLSYFGSILGAILFLIGLLYLLVSVTNPTQGGEGHIFGAFAAIVVMGGGLLIGLAGQLGLLFARPIQTRAQMALAILMGSAILVILLFVGSLFL